MVLSVALNLLLGGSTQTSIIAQAETSITRELTESVFVTEDFPGWGMDGCDAISIANGSTGQVMHRGDTLVSPGRIAISLNPLIVFAARSNGMYTNKQDFDSIQDDWSKLTDVYALRQLGEEGRWVTDHLNAPVPVQYVGGIAVSQASQRLFLGDRSDDRMCREDMSFGVSSYDISAIEWDERRLGRPLASVRTTLPIAYLFASGNEERLIALGASEVDSGDGASAHVLVMKADDLSPIGDPIPIPPVVSAEYRCGLGAIHAAVSPDERWLITNRWNEPAVTVVDLVGGSARSVFIDNVAGTGGVAINYQENNAGMVAVHAFDKLVLLSLGHSGELREVGRTEVAVPDTFSAAPGGPKASIAWGGDGRFVIASEGRAGSDEFSIWNVRNDAMERAGAFEACEYREQNFPSDIVTMNRINPTATGLPTATPSSTSTLVPTHTATPTSTRAPTLVASNTPVSTSSPSRIHLPLLLREQCLPSQRRVDVVLVIDASSSMLEPTVSGRTKMAASIEAAQGFLSNMNLGAGDQAAVVSFHRDAFLLAPLSGDRPMLTVALAGIETAQFTRIDRGIGMARDELLGPRHDADNTPVMIVLTDGRANPVPAEVAVEEAQRAKDSGVAVFTIGLGSDLDLSALRSMASQPDHFYLAPDAEELAGIYRGIAVTIPCPASAYWGQRP